MTLTDREGAFVAELHRLADAEQPPLDLDPVAAVRGGRALRRRRAVRNGAVGVAATTAIVVGVVQLVSFEQPETEPAHPTQEPRTLGREQTTEIAPGVIAANLPRKVEIAGRTLQDLGFTSRFVRTIGGVETAPGASVLESLDQVTFDDREGVAGAGVTMHTVHDGELYQAMNAAWITRDTPEDYTGGATPTGLSSTVGLPRWSFEQFTLGSVPSWLVDPHVVLFSEQEFTLHDGSTSPGLEVPTFRALTDDGRLVFAVKITEEQREFRDDDEPLVDVVVYRDGDGSVFVGDQCGPGGLDACIARYGGPFLAAAGLVGNDVAPGDVAVITTPLEGLAGTHPPSSSGWGLTGGRWVLQSVVGGVVVANDFVSPGAQTIDDGPGEPYVAGLDIETGAELWRWAVGERPVPQCGPAHPGTGYEPSVLECWWVPDDDSVALRHTFHEARTGALLSEGAAEPGDVTPWPRYGGSFDRVVIGGLLVGPGPGGGLDAVDTATGDVAWHHTGAVRVLGTDGALVYALLDGWGAGQAVVVGLDPRDGSESWRTEVGDDVIDVVPVDGYLFAIHGVDYSAFELGFSRIG